MMNRWRRRLGAGNEKGFTLVEVMATIIVLVLIMGALAAIQIASFRAVRETRFFQQATALGNDAVEALRDLRYDDLSMAQDAEYLADVGVNIMGTCNGHVQAFDPDGAGPLDCEKVVTSPAPGFSDHIRTRVINDTTFTISRYVTWVDDDNQGGTDQDYRRISVIVRWTSNGVQRTYRSSTLVANARRGLPSPKFTLTPTVQTKEVIPTTTTQVVDFPHTLTQLGVDDAYDLVMTEDGQASMPSGWSVTFYRDAGVIGVFESGTDTPLTNTSGTAAVDTGILSTGEVFRFIAQVTVPIAEPVAMTRLAVKATPIEFAGQGRTVIDRLGPQGLELFLHNDNTAADGMTPPAADGIALLDMFLHPDAPTATTLFRYSTDFYDNTDGSNGGRFLDAEGASASEFEPDDMVNWVRLVGTPTTFQSTVGLTFWAAPAASGAACTTATDDIKLHVFLREKTSAQLGTGNAVEELTEQVLPTVEGACGFSRFDVTLDVTGDSVSANNYLELKIKARDTGGGAGQGDDVVVAYDTAAFPASILLPTGTL